MKLENIFTIVFSILCGALAYWYFDTPSVEYDGINWVTIDKVEVSNMKFTDLKYNDNYAKDYDITIECDITNNGEPLLPTKQGNISGLRFSPRFHLKNIGGLDGNNKEFKSIEYFHMFENSNEITFSNEKPFQNGQTIHCKGKLTLSEDDFKKYILDNTITYIPEVYVEFSGYTLTEYKDTPAEETETLRVIYQDNFTSTIKDDALKMYQGLQKK